MHTTENQIYTVSEKKDPKILALTQASIIWFL